MNGKNWKVIFDKGTAPTYIPGRMPNGKFRPKETVEAEARKKTNLMLLPCGPVQRTTVEEDQTAHLWEDRVHG